MFSARWVSRDEVLSSSELESARQSPVSDREFHAVRNAVLQALRPLGSVGAMGTAPLSADERDKHWQVETPADECDFFVIDDQWSDTERFLRVEPKSPRLISLELFHALDAVLKQYPEWEVLLGFSPDALASVRLGMVLVSGDAYVGISSAEDLVKRCAEVAAESEGLRS